jgi:spore coat protein A, manganese oxidase
MPTTFACNSKNASRFTRLGVAVGILPLLLAVTAPVFSRAALADAEPPPCGASPMPTFFKDPVQQPPVAAPATAYTLYARKGVHTFSTDWPPVPSLGYTTNGTASPGEDLYLGPTIVTTEGTPVDVTLVNGLPAAPTRMFPFDPALDGNKVVLHRHGGLQDPVNDGIPGQETAPNGSRLYHYPNNQAAAPVWYHDHGDETTSYRVYEGLAGYMPNTDAIETQQLNNELPSGAFSKAFVLQDKSFNSDKTMCYTHVAPEFFGDLPVVNGTVAPFQKVEPRRYTFTFINGSDSRFYHVSLTGGTGPAPKMTVVGGDQGYLLNPARVSDLLVAPGERYKVVVDFTGHASQDWVLSNDAATPYPGGDPSVATIPQLMQFRVGAAISNPPDTSFVPPVIGETNNLTSPAVSLLTARLRTVQAGEIIPGAALLGDKAQLDLFDERPIAETPQLGSTEVWAMRNASPDTHPIHEHLVELRLVGRWHVGNWIRDPNHPELGAQPDPATVGQFEAPGAWESGPKDTMVSPKDYITAWVGTYTVAGQSVWHCHILSHEDAAGHEMMRPLVIGTAPQTQLPVVGTQQNLDALIRLSDTLAATTAPPKLPLAGAPPPGLPGLPIAVVTLTAAALVISTLRVRARR